MADSYLPLIKKIVAVLKANGAVAAFVGTRVYTDVPQNAAFPYIIVSATSGPASASDVTGMEHVVNVMAFSRKPSPEEAGGVRAAAIALLDRNESGLTLDTGNLYNINYTGLGFVTKEQDGVTWQSLAQFRAVVMD